MRPSKKNKLRYIRTSERTNELPQPWTGAQVEQLNMLVLKSQFGEQPVHIEEWPGPPLSSPCQNHCWMRFIELPEIVPVKHDYYAVTMTMEPASDPSGKQGTA